MTRRDTRGIDLPADATRLVEARYHQLAQLALLAQATGAPEDREARRAFEIGLRICCRHAAVSLEQVQALAERLRRQAITPEAT